MEICRTRVIHLQRIDLCGFERVTAYINYRHLIKECCLVISYFAIFMATLYVTDPFQRQDVRCDCHKEL